MGRRLTSTSWKERDVEVTNAVENGLYWLNCTVGLLMFLLIDVSFVRTVHPDPRGALEVILCF